MSIESMKQAIDALQCARHGHCDHLMADQAIEALRTAVKQAEAQQVEKSTATPEPVWFHKHWCDGDDIFYRPDDKIPSGATPLYTHPVPGVPDDVARDAERYRWLRQHQLLAKINYMPTPSGEDLDAAIDAAKVGGKQ